MSITHKSPRGKSLRPASRRVSERRRQRSGRRKGSPGCAVAEALEHSADGQSGSAAAQAQRLHIALPLCAACRAESHGDRKLTSACRAGWRGGLGQSGGG